MVRRHGERRHLSGRRRIQDLLSLLAAVREATRRGRGRSRIQRAQRVLLVGSRAAHGEGPRRVRGRPSRPREVGWRTLLRRQLRRVRRRRHGNGRRPAPDFALAVLKGLSHIAPHAHVLHLKNEDFSRDPAAVARMNADPLIANETQPTKTVAEMVRADERLKKEFPLITLPLLILHGTADQATKPSGSKLFHETAGSKDKTLKLYDGAFHDLLNDTDKQTVMGDIQRWLDAHPPPF